MNLLRALTVLPLLLVISTPAVSSISGCSGPTQGQRGSDDIVQGTDDHWFYDGPLPMLENPQLTVSLAGQTVRVSGLVPQTDETGKPITLDVSSIPHAKTKTEGGRTRLDVVYPIAIARPGKTNSSPGSGYGISEGKLFRPDGNAVTVQEGVHHVTWGGFPFIPYNEGIAFHGPITSVDPGDPSEASAESDGAEGDAHKVWYLKRAQVSGGCNRMMGEHVVELANLIGFDMHAVHTRDVYYPHLGGEVPVTVTGDYDTYDGQLVDVDYPTYDCAPGDACAPMKRPKADATHGVAMFGSWVASSPGGASDVPADGKWEGGIAGHVYDFTDPKHARAGWVCALPAAQLKGKAGMRAPRGFCASPNAAALVSTK